MVSVAEPREARAAHR